MSQIFTDSGGSPAADVETLTGNDSIIVGPDGAFNINVLGAISSDFNILELQTVGNAGTNTITITQFNTITGFVSVAGGTTANIISFDLDATAAAFIMDISMVCTNTVNAEAAGYNIFGTIRTDGAAATLVGVPDKVVNEDVLMIPGDANMSASVNNFLLTYTAPAGLNVDVTAYVKYTRQDFL